MVIHILLKSSISYVIASAIVSAGNFVILPFLTQTLSQVEYGYLAAFHLWCALITVFISMNLPLILQREITLTKETENRHIFAEYLLFTFYGSVLCICLSICIAWFQEDPLFLFVALGAVFYSIYQLTHSYYIVTDSRLYVVLSSLFIGVLTPILSIYLIKDFGVNGRIIAILVVIFSLLLLSFVLSKRNKFKASMIIPVPQTLTKQIFTLYPHSLSNFILAQGDRFIFALFATTADFGVYFLSVQLFQTVFIGFDSVNKSFHVWMLRKLSVKTIEAYNNVKRQFLILYVIGSIITFLVMIYHRQLLNNFIGVNFASYAEIFDIMLLSFFIVPLNFYTQNFLTYLGAFDDLSKSTVYSVLIWLICSCCILYSGLYEILPYLLPLAYFSKLATSVLLLTRSKEFALFMTTVRSTKLVDERL